MVKLDSCQGGVPTESYADNCTVLQELLECPCCRHLIGQDGTIGDMLKNGSVGQLWAKGLGMG